MKLQQTYFSSQAAYTDPLPIEGWIWDLWGWLDGHF